MPPRHAFQKLVKSILSIMQTIEHDKVFRILLPRQSTVNYLKLILLYKMNILKLIPIVNIQVNKHCMTDQLLLDNTKLLCLFDTCSNVNLISESVIQISEYLSSIPILDFPDYTITNTTSEINANKFIELCFRVKDDFILTTTALVLPDFCSVIFLLSISSINHLNSVIDVSVRQISIRKKSFVFKTSFHNRVKAHNTITIGIKCSLSEQLRNGDFVAKPFCPFSNYLPFNFMLQFMKGKSYLKIANPNI